MSASVLARLTLGYRHLWNRQRRAAAIELTINTTPQATGVDARHLVATLTELWPAGAPRLLLSIRHAALLHDMLFHGPADGAWVAVPQPALEHPVLRERVQQAHARGLPLVWQGGPGQRPPPELQACFQLGMYGLDPAQTVQVLQGLQTRPPNDAVDGGLPTGQILQAPASRVLADWALDRRHAWAVAGWPLDESLDSLRGQASGPGREVVTQLLRALDRDASLDQLEALLGADPVLAYRFLRHLNQPALQLRGPIDSLQRGLMVWGTRHLQQWLQAELDQAGETTDLHPVRSQLLTRARLLVHLLDPGDEDELRRELHLCGLFSQIDQLLGEPLATAVERLPLSQRLHEALLERSGPYHVGLQLARLLESTDTRSIHQFCENEDFDPEDVNRALLRTLADLPT